MLDIRLVVGPERSDTLVLPVRNDDGTDAPAAPIPTAVTLPDELTAEATALASVAALTGRAGEAQVTLRPPGAPLRLVLLGVGAGTEADWRAAGAALARTVPDETRVTVALPADAPPTAVRGLVEGVLLASYRFRLTDSGHTPALAEVELAVTDPQRYAGAVDTARTTARMTRFARDLTNMPSSVKSPEWFAGQVAAAAADLPDLDLRVWQPDELAEAGFGGVLAVGGGSARGPRMVELGWHPAGATTHVVLVGKGITFDTGGISIKPVSAMKLMRKDMAGAAAVVAATVGAAALRLPVRVTTLAPLAENMLSGSAFRPGDVVRHYGGRTSETTNSDAEGRLVLADALAYAVDRLAPDVLVDLATLTGANAVALGSRTAALYSDHDGLAGALVAAAAEAGEQAWRMPLVEDYVEYLGSDLADYYSAPARGAGSVVAALFLREFAGDLRDRWVHLDMSAPSWSSAADGELTRGATGWGVRALLRWLATLG
ncbi:leucyl aminopeptidase family protein [Micromonospora cathayae]|uniref:Probable cytosol aminopeptidase n=1 Tax=Micromonospora cathayae TaxID=3028804 RepID=A0ABY7ZUU5_9ACTN|nr:leucyl aminopeptidase family protein [Micromonospora sp. HUAS 3]WDZ86638.1 leucyl aminopeptidase family protein [Micromonospora sp. HUAS 3]